jgi:hypothetical protein
MKIEPFPPTSRYFGLPIAEWKMPDGRKIKYVLRRPIAPPESFTLLQEHTVKQPDRLDNLTAEYLGDPEQFWRLCDANAAMRPAELTETIGRRVRITLPAGIPGAPANA